MSPLRKKLAESKKAIVYIYLRSMHFLTFKRNFDFQLLSKNRDEIYKFKKKYTTLKRKNHVKKNPCKWTLELNSVMGCINKAIAR